MDTNKMRDDLLEQAFDRLGDDKGQGLHPYFKDAFRRGWEEAWRLSREAVVVELGAPSHWVADYAACGGGMTVFDAEKAAKVTDPMCSKTPAYTIHALEKVGLKVKP